MSGAVASYNMEMESSEKPPKNDVDDVIAKTDVDAEKEDEFKVKPYAGMGKEELLMHSRTKCWVTLRQTFIWFFFLCWLALICASIVLIIIFPRCKVAKTTAWWEQTSVYWIYPKSFQDSDQDGTGDIKGIENRLGHLENLGVNTILLDTIFDNGKVMNNALETGYDVTNFNAIDSVYGNLVDVETLINKTHEKDMHLLTTYVPNHTGVKHAWFTASEQDKTNKYKNFYIWRDCGNATVRTYPNNWLSLSGGQAWTYVATRNQCYLHQGSEFEPDLNLRNGDVQTEVEKVLTFWLEKGVDGFYLPRASHLIEDFDLRDEPNNTAVATGYNSLTHTYTQNLADTHDLIKRWRRLLDDFTAEKGGQEKFLILGGWGTTADEAKMYYDPNEAIEVMNHKLEGFEKTCGGKCVRSLVEEWLKGTGQQTTNWPLTSPSLSRPTTRFGADRVNALSLLSLTLPGTAFIYYGDELGMVDSTASGLKHPTDAYRSIMQWSNASMAGFTNGSTPWIPVNGDYKTVNYLVENATSNSTFRFFKNALSLRREDAMKQRDNLHYAVVNDKVFSFVKEWDGVARYLVAINFGTISSKDDYTYALSSIPAEATVVMTTENGVSFKKDDKVDMKKLEIGPQQGIVLTWDYVVKEKL